MKKRIYQFKEQYGHIIMPAALIGGFIIDIFTLNQIDQLFDNAILITHLLIAGTSIALLFSRGTAFGKKYISEKRKYWLETLMVFSFGALFSGFVIFYTRSGSLISSWPFIFVMVALMLGTEFQKKYFTRLRLQIIIYALAILLWTIFFVPVIIKTMGPWIFVLSNVVALLLIFGFFILLKKINTPRLNKNKKKIIIRIGIIFSILNVLYFTNIMPPIPLSLKYQAVYYEVQSTSDYYQAQYETTAWYNILSKRSNTMYWREGEDIFIFTRVFAPTQLHTTIQHVWEFYDESHRTWIHSNTISLPITGGRKDGYRGFSKKKNLRYGKWRVKTQTQNGQTLGIKRFDVEPYGPEIRELVVEEL